MYLCSVRIGKLLFLSANEAAEDYVTYHVMSNERHSPEEEEQMNSIG